MLKTKLTIAQSGRDVTEKVNGVILLLDDDGAFRRIAYDFDGLIHAHDRFPFREVLVGALRDIGWEVDMVESIRFVESILERYELTPLTAEERQLIEEETS